MANTHDLPEGTVLNERYEIEAVLGSGGFGITYRAFDRLLSRDVAIKEFFVDGWMERDTGGKKCIAAELSGQDKERLEKCRGNFRREAQIMKALRDIHYLSRIQESFSENDTDYIVMKLLEGESMASVVENKGKLSFDELKPMLEKLLFALEQMHEKGILHRDICPNNLLCMENGDLFLIDFGSATACDRASDLWNEQVFSNKAFEAPEHLSFSEQGTWTDLYSVCACIVYFLTGEGIPNPKDRELNDILPQMLMRTGLSAKQQNLLLKGLMLHPKKRFQQVRELRFALCGKRELPPQEWRVSYLARTDIGLRKINQDNLTVDGLFYYGGEDFERSGKLICQADELHLAAVCDGVGGAQMGELASRAAVQALAHFIEQYSDCEKLTERLLDELLDQMNEKVVSLGTKIGAVATTLSVLFWKGNHYWCVNIGDSPVYLLRGKHFTRLSTPHTRAQALLKAGKPVTSADFRTLTRYLGKEKTAGSQMASICRGHLEQGDVFLICSDGVSERADEQLLRKCVMKAGGNLDVLWKMLERKEKRDNCTAVLIRF